MQKIARIVHASKDGSNCCESTLDSNSGITERSEFRVRRERFLRSWNCEQFWSAPRSQSTLDYFESQNNAQPRLPHDTRNTVVTSGNVFERLQGGRLALCSFRHPKLGMAPLSVPFRSEWAPLGGPGDRNFDAGARFRALFLVWASPFLLSPKPSKLEWAKIRWNTQWMDQKCMLFDTSCFKNLLLTWGKVHIDKMKIFSKFRSPSFLHSVFHHLRHGRWREWRKHRWIEIRFLGPLGPFWDWGGRNFGSGHVSQYSRFYHVLSASGAVGVCGECHGVKWGVKWRVFALCLWAVWCFCATRRNRLWRPSVKCWFFTCGRVKKRSKEDPAHVPTHHLLRWSVLRLRVVLDAAAAALDARRLQTFSDTSDRATWLKRNPGVDERCGTNALLFTAMDQQTRSTHDNSCDVGQNTRNKTHRPASAPRGRPMLRDAMSPSERSLRSQRFVVAPLHIQRGRDLLGAEASGRNALHVETLLCGSQHVVRRLENTCDLREMWLVVYGYVIKSVMCVSVQRVKTCCFVINLTPEGIFYQKEIEICCFHPNFDLTIFNDNTEEKWTPDAQNAGEKAARKGPPSALSENSKNLASSSHGLRPDIAGNTMVREKEMKREQQNSSIPAPRCQRGSGIHNHIGGTYSHGGVMDYTSSPTSEMNLGKFPNSMEFQSWKVNFKTESCSETADPRLTVRWIKEVEIAKSIDELVTSRSILERTDFSDCDTLDAMIASALKKLINTHVHFRKRK